MSELSIETAAFSPRSGRRPGKSVKRSPSAPATRPITAETLPTSPNESHRRRGAPSAAGGAGVVAAGPSADISALHLHRPRERARAAVRVGELQDDADTPPARAPRHGELQSVQPGGDGEPAA